MRHALNVCAEEGHRNVNLSVDSHKAVANRLYENEGFSTIDEFVCLQAK